MPMISFMYLGFTTILCIIIALIERVSTDKYYSGEILRWLLLIFNYIFAGYMDCRFAIILFALSVSTWFCAKRDMTELGIIISILTLAIFKYTNFFLQSMKGILGLDLPLLNLFLPLGISFYSFSAISYLVDVKNKKLHAKCLIDVALYLSFFPRITSGPIQRSDQFYTQLEKDKHIEVESILEGIQVFSFGLFKKLVLADHLSLFVDQVFDKPMAFSSITVILAAISYSLQIYFDFSGYSDMAIGTAKCIGFDLPRNFNLPYLAHNVTEFWKRWHITLSSWLQDYLYIPLGGSRKGEFRTYINLVITMVIGGLWHGANWTYIVWGLLHGTALVVHKLWMKVRKSDYNEHGIITSTLSILTTFLFSTFCWIFFRAESIEKAISIIKSVFSFSNGIYQPYTWLYVSCCILLVYSLFAYKRAKNHSLVARKANMSIVEGYYPLQDLSTFQGMVVFFVFLGLIICFAYTGGSPFIYGKY